MPSVDPIVVVVALPLAAAVLAAAVGPRASRWVAGAAACGTPLAVAALTRQVWLEGPLRYPVGGWGAPLGIELAADGLALLMLWLTAAVAACTTLYAAGTPERDGEERGGAGEPPWPLWLVLWGALDALFLSADAFNIYVALELVSLAAVALVALGGGAAIGAAARYLLVSMVGSLVYLLGVALLYAQQGVLDLHQLGRSLAPNVGAEAALALMLAGLLLKSALFPLHGWLPPAHAGAPGPVSAVLSALVVTATYSVALRLWTHTFAGVTGPGAGALLGALASAAILWGSVQALRARRLKFLVAYSTVAQVGQLALAFPLALDAAASAAALAGGTYLALSHGVAKAAMFLAASTIVSSVGHDRIDDLGGLGARLPITAVSFGLAGVSLMGLPVTGGFLAKWLLLTAAVQAHAWWAVAVLLASGLLTAGYVWRVVGRTLAEGEEGAAPLRAPRSRELATLALALGSVALGLLSAPALALLDLGAPLGAR